MFDFLKREFMLGVGAGMIISGIMVSLSGTGQLTDEEVRARAAKLGMVQKQEAGHGQSVAKPQKPETQKPEPQKPDQAANFPAAKPVDVKLSSSENRQDITSENSSPVSQSDIKEKVGVVTVEVKPGMGSETVIRILEQKGAISDREEFYKVMTKYNAHSKLKVGTFKIPDGTSMKGIVDILTGKDR